MGFTRGLEWDYWGISGGYAEWLGRESGLPALGAPEYWHVRIKTAVPGVPQANHPYPSKS